MKRIALPLWPGDLLEWTKWLLNQAGSQEGDWLPPCHLVAPGKQGLLKSWRPPTGSAGGPARRPGGLAEPAAGALSPAVLDGSPPECCPLHIPQELWWQPVCSGLPGERGWQTLRGGGEEGGRGWPEGDPSSALSSQAAVRLPPLVKRGAGCGPLCSFSCSCMGFVGSGQVSFKVKVWPVRPLPSGACLSFSTWYVCSVLLLFWASNQTPKGCQDGGFHIPQR